ncbi:Gfo/Idh/MocA family protein [Campylobacter concisus]|uniref:Gfo/Idh/MocA family protein n=1 Tax=Campylobacter concisus TaxID=199 RepID=UPI000CD854A1|nr:Gfo/Idh/MocA family oxidoreductase [Campylobacter concisus]
MKLKIGIVGYNLVGKRHYMELRRSDKFEVCGVFDRENRDDACRAPFFDDFKEFIENAQPQAMVLCLPQHEIVEAFCQCVKYCQNILISRPIFKSVSELKEIKYAAGVNKARVCTGVDERFNPTVFSLKKALLREEEIYSISIAHFKPLCEGNIINELSLCDIDLAKNLAGSEICDFFYIQTNKTNKRLSDNVGISLKMKNQILVNITDSFCGSLERFKIEVNAKDGVYFGDLIDYKLHRVSENGQMNLKTDSLNNEIKAQYEAFYDLCQSGESSELSNIDDAIKIKELF